MQDSRAERAAKAGETASFSARGECALIRDHARGLQETALLGPDKRLATTTGNGFSATELAGKPVMVSKETGGSLHIVVARVMHCNLAHTVHDIAARKVYKNDGDVSAIAKYQPNHRGSTQLEQTDQRSNCRKPKAT